MRAQSNIVNIRLVSLATSPDNFLFSSYSFIILCFFLLCFWMLSILWLFLDANDISSYCVALEYDITLVWFLKFSLVGLTILKFIVQVVYTLHG